MRWLFPEYLLGGLAGALLVTVLHLIVRHHPSTERLPTARFVPPQIATAPTLNRRPHEVFLLLLRVAAVLLVAAAFARPVIRPHRTAILPIVVADRSRAVADAREVADSVRRIVGDRRVGTLILFDSTPRLVALPATDTMAQLRRSGAQGSISAALVAAVRTASQMRGFADSIELSIVSPLAADELDAATDSISRLWPARIRIVAVSRSSQPAGRAPSVHWLSDTSAGDATARERVDTADAVIAGQVVVVAGFVRHWRLDAAGARVIARWIDGEPAAIERALPGGACEHIIAIEVPADGDIGLRLEVRRLRSAMASPCGVALTDEPYVPSPSAFTSRATGRASTRLLADTPLPHAWLVPWLLAGAVALLVIEMTVRRRRSAP